MTPDQRLAEILRTHPSSPFLFIGSGFSQRYLGTPGWADLLRRFAEGLNQFAYYYSSADAKLPRCASLIAEDFAKKWWTDPNFDGQRTKYESFATSGSSPLKIAISDYLKSHVKIQKDTKLVDELNALRALNVEGIITTNWDCLLENLFPGYKVYVGQQSVVRQTPQNIGEIFKIHGCCTEPNSLVLTEQDYKVFRDKQAYLAAKLITIFVEHPVVFIGYSIQDETILDLLRSIVHGLGSEEIKSLQRNLIFLQRPKQGRLSGVSETVLLVEGTTLPITNIVTDDFTSVYSALANTKLKLPARVLRFCKEQLYELVSAKEPSQKLCLANIDDIENKDEIEFVVGIGVVGAHVGDKGYAGVSTQDIFKALIFGDSSLSAERVLEHTIPDLDCSNNYLPVYRFINECRGNLKMAMLNPSVIRLVSRSREDFKSRFYQKTALRELQSNGRDFDWFVRNLPPEKAAIYIPFMPDDKIPLDKLLAFAQENFKEAFSGGHSTYFRKLFCLYDYLKFGGSSLSPQVMNSEKGLTKGPGANKAGRKLTADEAEEMLKKAGIW